MLKLKPTESLFYLCVRPKQPSQHTHTVTHTSFCDHSEKITLLCMTGVTSIEENNIEKHKGNLRGKQCRAIFKNTTWPEMPFKTHRLIPTRENEIEVLLEIPLRQYPVTATAPGLHHWKQLQKISETLVSSRFPTT